jgi:hypothetical protein
LRDGSTCRPARTDVTMSRLSNLVASATDPASGWDARLWWLWALYTALAYTVILGVILGLTSLGLHVTQVALDHRFVGTLSIATFGAVLYGAVPVTEPDMSSPAAAAPARARRVGRIS